MVYLSVTILYPSTQFEELYGPFVNLGVHLTPKDNSPFYLSFYLNIKFHAMININNNKGNEGFKYTKFIMTLPSLFFIQTCVLTLAVGSKK